MRWQVVFLASCAMAQQPPRRWTPPPSTQYQITVKDSDTGAPLAGAHVVISTASGNRGVRTSESKTGISGQFGVYLSGEDRSAVSVDMEGYVNGWEAMERGPLVLAVQPEVRVQRLEIALHRAAQITGRVFDDELEKGVAGLMVRPHYSFFQRGKRVLRGAAASATTDAEGNFRLRPLPPGEYFLEVMQKNQESIEENARPAQEPVMGYARVYWPGGGPLESAPALHLVAGAQIKAGDIHVKKQPLYQAQGALITRNCSPVLRYRLVVWEKKDGRTTIRANTLMNCNRPFTIHNLAAGWWVFEGRLNGEVAERTETASVEIEIKEEDVKAEVLLVRPLLVPLRVRDGGERLPEGFKAGLAAVGRPVFEEPDARPVMGAGPVLLAAPPTEKAQLQVRDLEHPFAVAEIRYNGGLAEEGVFTVNRQAPSQLLEVVITDKAGVVTGVVKKDDRPVGGAMVVLAEWPIALRTEWPATQRARTADDGKFAFAGLAPGKYRVFAVEKDRRLKLEEPGSLLRLIGRGQEAEVGEGQVHRAELQVIEP